MYVYKIGYGTYEESDFTEMSHPRKFDEDTITEFISEAIAHMLPNFGKNWDPTYQDLHQGVCCYLVKKFNFEFVQYELTWSVFGWAAVLDNKDWGHDRGETLNKLTYKLNKKGLFKKRDEL